MSWPDPIALRHRAEALVDALDSDLVDLLRDEPDAGIAALGITVVETTVNGDGCDLDASYNRRTHVISVAGHASSSRRHFSLLHELGHHRINTTPTGGEVADWLDKFGDHSDAIEERVCDAFAAAIMFSDRTASTLPVGFNANHVIDLFVNTGASREACCVYAAQHLMGPGLVVLAYDSVVLFSAPHSLPFRVSRGVQQDAGSSISKASTEGVAFAHRERLSLRSGPSFTDLDGDARLHDGYVFAVFRESRQRTDRHGVAERSVWTCPTCGDDISDEDWCNGCSRRICPECGCGCARRPGTSSPRRRCGRCGVTVAPALDECELCGTPVE